MFEPFPHLIFVHKASRNSILYWHLTRLTSTYSKHIRPQFLVCNVTLSYLKKSMQLQCFRKLCWVFQQLTKSSIQLWTFGNLTAGTIQTIQAQKYTRTWCSVHMNAGKKTNPNHPILLFTLPAGYCTFVVGFLKFLHKQRTKHYFKIHNFQLTFELIYSHLMQSYLKIQTTRVLLASTRRTWIIFYHFYSCILYSEIWKYTSPLATFFHTVVWIFMFWIFIFI